MSSHRAPTSGRPSAKPSRARSPVSVSSCWGVDVRDVMVPSELKRAFAGIVAARREGEAAVERARGETAALRGLANAGRMLEDSPGLLQLRILQQLGASSGNSIVLGWPGSDGTGIVAPPSPAGTKPTRPAARGRAEG